VRTVRTGTVVVVTCMDPRLRVEAFGLGARGGTSVLRNAGGRTTDDVVRSLVVAWWALGATEFVVVHHTECRMMAATNQQLRDDLVRAVEVDTRGLDFLVFTDLRASVEEDVARIRESPYLVDAVPASGFVWDMGAEQLQPVVVDPRSRFATRAVARGLPRVAGTAATGGVRACVTVPSGGIWGTRR
jgi:carbonic anhydrase